MENLAKIGRWFYAISLIGLAGEQFYFGAFWPVFVPAFPSHIPGQIVLVYLFSLFLVWAGVALILGKEVRATMVVLGSLLLALFLFCHIPYELWVDPGSKSIGSWNYAIKDLLISGSAFIIAGYFSLGIILFAQMLVIFGIEHFLYAQGVQTLVPDWIPGHLFWTYFAAVALIGAGLAFVFRVKVKWVGILTAVMIFLWFLILHIPRAVMAPATDHGNELASVFESLGCSGIALVIAYAADRVRPKRDISAK